MYVTYNIHPIIYNIDCIKYFCFYKLKNLILSSNYNFVFNKLTNIDSKNSKNVHYFRVFYKQDFLVNDISHILGIWFPKQKLFLFKDIIFQNQKFKTFLLSIYFLSILMNLNFIENLLNIIDFSDSLFLFN